MAYSPNGTKGKSKFYEDQTSYLPVVSEGTKKKNWKRNLLEVLLNIATVVVLLLVVAFVAWMILVGIPIAQGGW